MQQPAGSQSDRPEQSFDERVGTELRELRVLRGLSQREVASRMAGLGVVLDSTAITRIEKGSRSLRFEEAIAIADVLDTRLEHLLWSVNDAAEQIRRMRDRANGAMHDARAAAWEFLYDVQLVRQRLTETPTALSNTSPEHYYDWVLDRLKDVWTRADDEPEAGLIYEPDEADAKKLQAMAEGLTREIVKVGEVPQEIQALRKRFNGEHSEEA